MKPYMVIPASAGLGIRPPLPSIHVCSNTTNNNNWNLYSAFSIHKMFKSAAHCHSLSNSPQRLTCHEPVRVSIDVKCCSKSY